MASGKRLVFTRACPLRTSAARRQTGKPAGCRPSQPSRRGGPDPRRNALSYRLSVLDKVAIPKGATASEAFGHAAARARRAEELGYHRYWFAEHHASPLLASPAPEIAIAYILARTSRIRVGAGGILLQHYAPFKVAEVFRVLSALAPGRVDLGIGRAPGGLPPSTRALRRGGGEGPAVDFEAKFAELDDFLNLADPAETPEDGVFAFPRVDEGPQRILLGASVASAELAASRGWNFAFAGHFDGDTALIEQVFETFRARTGRAPMLAVAAAAAESEAASRALVGEVKLFRVHLPNGQYVNLPNEAAAEAFARQAGAESYRLEPLAPMVLTGTGAQVRAELDRLHDAFGVEEFIVDSPLTGFADRLASIELLAMAAPLAEAA